TSGRRGFASRSHGPRLTRAGRPKARAHSPRPRRCARIFVSDRHRRRDRLLRPLVPVEDMDVGAANAGLVDLDQNVVGTERGNRLLAEPQSRLRFLLDQRFHRRAFALAEIVRPGTAGAANELKLRMLRLGGENTLKLGHLLALLNRRKPGGRSKLGCVIEALADAPRRVHQRREPAILRMNLLFKNRHGELPTTFPYGIATTSNATPEARRPSKSPSAETRPRWPSEASVTTAADPFASLAGRRSCDCSPRIERLRWKPREDPETCGS